MKLSPIEMFALRILLRDKTDFEEAVFEQLDMAKVTERTRTKIGFFSTIHFPDALPRTNDDSRWVCTFAHKELNHGVILAAFVHVPHTIKLEGVAFASMWPTNVDTSLFQDSSIALYSSPTYELQKLERVH